MAKTILSVKDFSILYRLTCETIYDMERVYYNYNATEIEMKKIEEEHKKRLENNLYYQDLLRLRENLGNLNIEIETPNVEIKE